MNISPLAALCFCLLPLACSTSTEDKHPTPEAYQSTPSAKVQTPPANVPPAETKVQTTEAKVQTPPTKLPTTAAAQGSGFYALSSADIDGKPQALSQYAGKVALVVNTASECGYTPQYEGLQKLYAELAPRGFVVLGYPSNDFGAQEPGSAAEIKTFCTENYRVSFPLFSKVVTKPGAEQSPIYGLLGKETGKLPNWNFCKYLVAKDGKVLAFYSSKVTPSDAELRKAIDAALAAR